MKALRQVAESFDGPIGGWIYDRYDELNKKIFAKKLRTAMLRFELTPHGRALGMLR